MKKLMSEATVCEINLHNKKIGNHTSWLKEILNLEFANIIVYCNFAHPEVAVSEKATDNSQFAWSKFSHNFNQNSKIVITIQQQMLKFMIFTKKKKEKLTNSVLCFLIISHFSCTRSIFFFFFWQIISHQK